jgi:2-polyprenyl-6-hydroxyphenyl methylase/3-demethylubiquinone-9 3-methyltransferase
MRIDNELYDRMAGSWWDETGFLNILAAFIPPRFGYMKRVLCDEMRIDPRGLRTLDIGCGGGLLTEEFARLGCAVSGIDPSEKSLESARRHAEEQGLRIDYRRATGEAIPFPDAAFDAAYSCDVLEHVADLPRVIAETARILRPGGVFLYDTINRTWRSKLVVIKLFQEWRGTSFMPPDLHDWNLFIKPRELLRLLDRNGLRNRGMTGLGPAAGPFRVFQILRARKRGELSYVEAARRIDLHESGDTSILYMGHAVKSAAW